MNTQLLSENGQTLNDSVIELILLEDSNDERNESVVELVFLDDSFGKYLHEQFLLSKQSLFLSVFGIDAFKT